jgi:hypothetical protein
VPDPNMFSGDVSFCPIGSREWELVGDRAGYVDAARGIGLLDMLAAPTDEEMRASGRLALHTLEVMTAVLESARAGTRLTLETTVERPPLVPLGSSFALTEL